MKQLAKEYNKNGYHHTQIWREGDVAIYEMTSLESGKILCYEVFEVMKNEARVMGGRQIEATESTPSNEAWGQKGFSVGSKTAAFEKATMIQKNIEVRNLAKRIGDKVILGKVNPPDIVFP